MATPQEWDNTRDTNSPEAPTIFDRLEIGDIVQHCTGELWMITDVADQSATAVRTVQLRNPTQWRIVSKAHHTEVSPTHQGTGHRP